MQSATGQDARAGVVLERNSGGMEADEEGHIKLA